MSDALNAGTVQIGVVYVLDNEQLRAVAAQGRAELEQQMAGIKIGVAADAQAGASRAQVAPSPELLSGVLPPVATGAGGGATSSPMAQATRQARLDASRARMRGGKSAQIDSLITAAQAIGGTAGEWLETAATMMFAQTREAFTKSAQSAAKKAGQQVARDKNSINRVALQDAKAVSGAALSIRNLDPEARAAVLKRAADLRADYGVDYRTSVAAATTDFKAGEKRVERAERNRDLAGLAQQKQDEKAVVAAKNKNNQLALQAARDEASATLRARDLSKDEQKAVQDRAGELRKTHGTSYKESFGAALQELNNGRREKARAGRMGVDQFMADIAEQSPGEQRRSIDRYLAENEGMDPRDRIRLERHRGQLYRKTPLGQFFGPPSTMGLMLNAMFGGIEVGHAALAYGRAANAIGSADQLKAYTQAADSIAGGFLGSFANMAVDPLGTYRSGTDAVAKAAELNDARTQLRRADRTTMREVAAHGDAVGQTGILATVEAAKAQADNLRSQAEAAKAEHDKLTDAEIASARQTNSETHDARRDQRYLYLQGTAALIDGETGAHRQDRLMEQAGSDVDRDDNQALQQLRKQRNGERDRVVKAYTNAADNVEKFTARNILFTTLAGAVGQLGAGLVTQTQAGGDPMRASRQSLMFQQAAETAALQEKFRGTGQNNVLYRAAAAAMGFMHTQQRVALVNQQDQDLDKTRSGTRAITEGIAGRSLEARYASIDEQMVVQHKNGQVLINGYAPGAQGYTEQAARRDAMRQQAGSEYKRELIRQRTFERAATSQLADRPLQATIDQILGDAEADTVGTDAKGTAARARWRQAGLQVQLAQQQFNNQTTDIESGQLFETKSLTRQLRNDPVGAEAYELAGSSLTAARQLFRSGRPEDAENERRLGNARLDVLQHKYADSFEAVALDPRTMGFDAHNGQDPNEVFGTIDSARNDLNNGGLASSTDDSNAVLGEIRDAMKDLKAAFDAISRR